MIRRANEKDIDVITDYNYKMALETEDLELDKETLKNGVKHAVLDDAKAVYFLYEIDDKVIGQLMITREWSDWRDGFFWWIQSVYVKKEYRRRGIFRELYKYVEKLVEEDDEICGLRLYVEKENERAKNTYKKMGMEETHYLLYEFEK